MAKTGRKTILLHIREIDDLDHTISFAEHKAKSGGLRLSVDYKHDTGLKLNVAGPKGKINLFEHQVRDFMENLGREEE